MDNIPKLSLLPLLIWSTDFLNKDFQAIILCSSYHLQMYKASSNKFFICSDLSLESITSIDF